MMQQLIVAVIVAAASIYVVRYLIQSVKGILTATSKTGCTTGCGKCEFSAKSSGSKTSSTASNLISLSDIRVLHSQNSPSSKKSD